MNYGIILHEKKTVVVNVESGIIQGASILTYEGSIKCLKAIEKLFNSQRYTGGYIDYNALYKGLKSAVVLDNTAKTQTVLAVKGCVLAVSDKHKTTWFPYYSKDLGQLYEPKLPPSSEDIVCDTTFPLTELVRIGGNYEAALDKISIRYLSLFAQYYV